MAQQTQNTGSSQAKKVLRVGLFQNNRIIEERLLTKPSPLYITNSPTNKEDHLVVLGAEHERLKFFDLRGGTYVLLFTKSMTGRIRIGEGVQTLQDLIQSGKAKSESGNYAIALPPNAQGRLVVGDATFLFQFVVPPPPRPTPVLPASMRGGWVQGMDRILATMLALSLVIHVGFVAFLEFQDWPEPLEQEFDIPDQFVTLVVDKPEEIEPVEPVEPEETSEEGEGEGEEPVAEKPAPKKEKPAAKDAGDDKPEENDKPQSAEELAQKEADRKRRLADQVRNKTILSQIGAKSSDGSSGGLLDTLTNGAGSTSVEEAFAGSSSITTGSAGTEKGGLRSSGSSGADGSGGKSVGIGALGPSKSVAKAGRGVGTGTKTQKRVKARVNIRGPEKVIGGTLDKGSLSRVLKRKQGDFQRCYERELKKNPKAGGKVVAVFTIGSAGRVTSSSAQVDSVGGGVGTCVAGIIKRLRFPKPSGGDATIKKTMVFAAGG